MQFSKVLFTYFKALLRGILEDWNLNLGQRKVYCLFCWNATLWSLQCISLLRITCLNLKTLYSWKPSSTDLVVLVVSRVAGGRFLSLLIEFWTELSNVNMSCLLIRSPLLLFMVVLVKSCTFQNAFIVVSTPLEQFIWVLRFNTSLQSDFPVVTFLIAITPLFSSGTSKTVYIVQNNSLCNFRASWPWQLSLKGLRTILLLVLVPQQKCLLVHWHWILDCLDTVYTYI